MFHRNRSPLRMSLVVGAVLVPALLLVGRGPGHPPDAVINPSGASTPSDWRASSDTGRTSVSRVTVKGGPDGVTTAIEVSRDGGGGRWALALCGLRDAGRFFQPGHTYRMQAYVRDVNSSDQSLGLLLANSNFLHRPTDETRYARYTDTSWHLLQRTFVARAGAAADTGLYFALPLEGSLRWQFTEASVHEVQPAQPRTAGGDPQAVVAFPGAPGTPPDPATWTHELGGNGWGDDELQSYTASASNAAVDGQGNLVITARREDVTGPDGIPRHYSSGRLDTSGKLEVRPGSYLEAEVRAPVGKGARPGVWLIGSNWPQVGWPASGELDLLEGTQQSPDQVRQTIHVAQLSQPGDDAPYGEYAPGGYTDLGQPRDAGFHRYGVYFDENVVQFYVDRKPTLRLTSQEASESDRAWPFDRPQTLVVNLAVGGTPDPAAFPAALTIRRISVWNDGVPF